MSQDNTDRLYMCPHCHAWFDAISEMAERFAPELAAGRISPSDLFRTMQTTQCPSCSQTFFVRQMLDATEEAKAHRVTAEVKTPSAPAGHEGTAGADKAAAKAPRRIPWWKFWDF